MLGRRSIPSLWSSRSPLFCAVLHDISLKIQFVVFVHDSYMQFNPFIQCLTNQIAIGLVWRGEEIRILKTLLRRFSDKEPACQCRRFGFNPWAGKIPWRRQWQPTPVFLPGESHGQRVSKSWSQLSMYAHNFKDIFKSPQFVPSWVFCHWNDPSFFSSFIEM